MLATINDFLDGKKIPSLDGVQMSALLHYLFSSASRTLRIQIAEIAYREHDHPNALDLFLACTLPLAQKVAERKATKIFLRPSDWQVELMYDGAVNSMISVFQRNCTLMPGTDGFQRYIGRALSTGAVRSYFMRQEYEGVRCVGNVATIPTRKKPVRNTVERDIITRELLEQVTSFPHLPGPVLATLQCITALGPDTALKEHAYTASGDPDKWERERGRRPILDPDVIAEAMGIRKRNVHRYLRRARVILREAFNADGKLFLTH